MRARAIDLAREGEITWLTPDAPLESIGRVLRSARNCVGILADDAFSVYISAHMEEQEIRMDGFRRVTPPFGCIWIDGGAYSALVRYDAADKNLDITGFHQAESGELVGPISEDLFKLDGEGVIIEHVEHWDFRDSEFKALPLVPALFVLSLCHSRELILRESIGLPREHHAPSQKPFSARYYVLDIKPARVNAGRAPKTLSEVMSRSLHSVRGHEVVFTAERPAFGRLVGKFWCPPHRRGSPKVGIVAKDYRVC